MFQMGNLLRAIRASNAVVAGLTVVNSSVVDTAGAESVLFVVSFGAITATAVTSIKAQQGAQANLSDAADLAGTAITVPDTASNKIYLLELIQPRKRYVRAVVTRGTANSAIDSIAAILFRPRKAPPAAQDATVGSYKAVLSPVEGAP